MGRPTHQHNRIGHSLSEVGVLDVGDGVADHIVEGVVDEWLQHLDVVEGVLGGGGVDVAAPR